MIIYDDMIIIELRNPRDVSINSSRAVWSSNMPIRNSCLVVCRTRYLQGFLKAKIFFSWIFEHRYNFIFTFDLINHDTSYFKKAQQKMLQNWKKLYVVFIRPTLEYASICLGWLLCSRYWKAWKSTVICS